jgi:hypothetical protein
MEALPPRFNKLRRASGPAEIENNSIRFYPVSYNRRVGCTSINSTFIKKRIFCVQSRDLLTNKKLVFLQIPRSFLPHGNELSITGGIFSVFLAVPKFLYVYTMQIDYNLDGMMNHLRLVCVLCLLISPFPRSPQIATNEIKNNLIRRSQQKEI